MKFSWNPASLSNNLLRVMHLVSPDESSENDQRAKARAKAKAKAKANAMAKAQAQAKVDLKE